MSGYVSFGGCIDELLLQAGLETLTVSSSPGWPKYGHWNPFLNQQQHLTFCGTSACLLYFVSDSWARVNRWAASVADAIFCAVQRLSSSLPYCGLYLLFFHQMNVLVLLYMGCTENNYFLTFFRSIIDFWIVYVLIFYKVRFDIVESSHQKFKKCIIQFGEIFNYVACLRRLPCSSLITVEVL